MTKIAPKVGGAVGAALVVLWFLCAAAAQAQTLDTLTKLAGLFEKAGAIIGNLAKGIEDANAAGLRVYDTYEARSAYDQLLDLRTDILVLPMVQRQLVLDPIDAYLDDPATARWTDVQANLDDVLARVVDVEQRLLEERSGFVLEPEFAELVAVIRARGGLLRKLKTIDPPMAEAELAKLREVRDTYARLIAELDRTRSALDAYLRRVKE